VNDDAPAAEGCIRGYDGPALIFSFGDPDKSPIPFPRNPMPAGKFSTLFLTFTSKSVADRIAKKKHADGCGHPLTAAAAEENDELIEGGSD